ncbi:MAG: Ig-like domain-containing protein [Gemmatimonadaceae bacterium]
MISPPGAAIFATGTQQLTASARTTGGSEVAGRTFTWSTDAAHVAKVSAAGAVTATGVGTAFIRAVDQGSGISRSVEVVVSAPPRPPGSLLSIGIDSILQFGSWVYVNSLIVIDTSATGKDYRISIIRKPDVPFVSPISRASFPLTSAIAECPNGARYLSNIADGTNSLQLWTIDDQTAFATSLGTLSIGSSSVSSMVCDATNSLLVVGNFAGFGTLFRVNPVTRQVTTIKLIDETFWGIARSPADVFYATVSDPIASNHEPQLFVSINPSTGVYAPVGDGQLREFFPISQMAFRGDRILGISYFGDELVEINAATGAVTVLRALTVR